MRVIIEEDPYLDLDRDKIWSCRGLWPCKWVCLRDEIEPPFVAAYRKQFSMNEDVVIRAHVSADERYELFLDGKRIGRGSERGDRNNWYYETYDIPITRGSHVIVARVWALGTYAPFAQMSVRPGFIFSTEGEFIEILGTGVSDWEGKKLGGYSFTSPMPAFGTGANLDIDGNRFAWGFESGEGDCWEPVEVLHPGSNASTRNEIEPTHLMKPATLPPMIEREIKAGKVRHYAVLDSEDAALVPIIESGDLTGLANMQSLLDDDAPITIPAYATHRAIIDMEDYHCAYPEITISGGKGGIIRIHWAESLFNRPNANPVIDHKGNRGEIEGKFFSGIGDIFRPDGGSQKKFDTLWWQAGRYIELLIKTEDEPITIESFRLRETRYPLEMQGSFESNVPEIARTIPIMLRGLQMCSHETYMDCPYYEQLMYTGDTRLEVLTTYAITRDDRLPRKALKMFDASRLNLGISLSRYPSRVCSIIPTFSLWWVQMIYDYALWRGDADFVRSLMPGARGVIDWWLANMNVDGLIQSPMGWNFTDWTLQWTDWRNPLDSSRDGAHWGVPPDGDFGVSCPINWHVVMTLDRLAKIEEWLSEPELASRSTRLASHLAERITMAFWDHDRGLFADDISKSSFSEHAQSLAVLSGHVDKATQRQIAEGLATAPDLVRATIYFSHYLLETYYELNMTSMLFDKLHTWFELDEQGFKTTPESPEPSRSDCHAWGAHPLYHLYASVLGIRPGSFGFDFIHIEPHLGLLRSVKASMPHPAGFINIDLREERGNLKGSIELPYGTSGTLVYAGETQPVRAGRQTI